jgi:hypothetical protein
MRANDASIDSALNRTFWPDGLVKAEWVESHGVADVASYDYYADAKLKSVGSNWSGGGAQYRFAPNGMGAALERRLEFVAISIT